MLKQVLLMWALLCGGVAQAAAPSELRYPVTDAEYPGVLLLEVDATDVERHIIQVRQRMPVTAGPLTLLYPEWIPGKHAPRGAIDRLAGLTISAAGAPVPWRRDPNDLYAFEVQVPAGTNWLDVEFQYLSPVTARVGAVESTPNLLLFNWHTVTLYPSGFELRRVPVEAHLKVPAEFTVASALKAEQRNGMYEFEPTTLGVLFDSSVFAGRHARRIELTPTGAKPVFLNVFADQAALLAATDTQITAHRKLVREAITLFGSEHYDRYEFLLHLTTQLAGTGLEHHRSSENVTVANFFTEWDKTPTARALLPHEFAHSWNGKFRMPATQSMPHFNTPITNELMWVYEGQTQYWGEVLTARSGLRSVQQERDSLAMIAAAMQRRVGREWRALVDTTNDPIILARRPQSFPSWQRSEDYYNEGLLIWLEVDMQIRELSRGKRSLDDFAKHFFGVRDGSWEPMPYTFNDIVATLNAVQPFSWEPFLNERVATAGVEVPFNGLERAGYKLVFTDKPTDYFKASEETRKVVDLIYSIGCILESGRITETQWQSTAFKAGLIAGDEIVAVNGEAYTGQILKDAITRIKGSSESIELLIKNDTRYRTVKLAYDGGLRYPRLERIDGRPPMLDKILAPLTRP